jgi:hypothetical protein
MGNENNIEEDYIKMKFNHPNMKNLTFFIKQGSSVTEGKKIGEFTIENIKQSITSPKYGKVIKLDLEEKEIIIEPCKHEAIYGKLCIECGYNLK